VTPDVPHVTAQLGYMWHTSTAKAHRPRLWLKYLLLLGFSLGFWARSVFGTVSAILITRNMKHESKNKTGGTYYEDFKQHLNIGTVRINDHRMWRIYPNFTIRTC